MLRSVCRCVFLLASSLVLALLAAGQEGPPPEIKGHIDALVKAFNSGSSDAWEKMAQAHFSPGELKRHSAEARKQVFEKDRFRSNGDYYNFVSSLKPLFAPGARTQYCNGCYIVLGAIIERVSGITYQQYVEENIFKPAGMAASGPLQTGAILPDVAWDIHDEQAKMGS